jgi:hypothetical protein
MLTPKATAEVKTLLGASGGPATLASIATWADDVRMLRPDTRTWHYVTLQIGEARYDSSRADSANVIKAIKRQLDVLARPGADRYAREEALKWAVHLIGDLHQPLHAGEDRDKGGNLAKVKLNRRTYNLHEVWDYVLLERLRLPLDSLRPMLERRIAADPGFIQRNAQGTVESWADATQALSPACYVLHGKRMRKGIKARLDRAYVDAATLTVLSQLQIGAVRLAWALNRAFDPGAPMPAPALRPPAGWRDDPKAFFARADSLRESPEAAEDSVPGTAPGAAAPASPAVAAPKDVTEVTDPAAATRGRGKGRSGKVPPGRYAWSVNSGVFHYRECADVARIKRKNLETADAPPPGKRLHPGCPSLR